MSIRTSPRHMATVLTLGTVAVVTAVAQHAGAQTLVESSAEARFQLDLEVPQAALMRFLPAGWTTNVSTQGNAKDANLRAIFIERLTINGPDGAPVGDGSNLLVYLTVPVTDPTGANVQLVIGGITEDPADAPGPFGVYLPATTHTLERTTLSGMGPIIESQDWAFAAATGEHLEMHITFERGVAPPRRFYSAKNPDFYDRSQGRAHREALDYPLRAYRHPCGSGSRTPAGHGMADGSRDWNADGSRDWNAALLPADPIAR